MSVDDLAQAVRDRRERLGLDQDDLAALGGPGVTTVNKIENRNIESPSRKTLVGLDRALGWTHGTAAGLLEGEAVSPEVADEGDEIMAALKRNTTLRPEARAHLINQYQLLLQLSGPSIPSLLAEQERRREDAERERQEAEVQRIGLAELRAVVDSEKPRRPRHRPSQP